MSYLGSMARRKKPGKPWPSLDKEASRLELSVIEDGPLRRRLSVTNRNHCATICPHREGFLLAWYTGRELSEDQRVVLVYSAGHGTYGLVTTFERGTGNPVLWAEPDGSATLLFSRFEGKHRSWKDCSLWLARIGAGVPTSVDPFPARDGLLGRCPPFPRVRQPDSILLPLYHEDEEYTAIYSRAGLDGAWERCGTIGEASGHLIQSTLWTIGKRYMALSRHRTGSSHARRMAWFSQSTNAREWTPPVLSPTFENTDNSIVVAPNGLDSWVVWNDGPGRSSLALAQLGTPKKKRILNQEPYAAYPNFCWTEGGDLHLVWTEGRPESRVVHEVIPGALWTVATPDGDG